MLVKMEVSLLRRTIVSVRPMLGPWILILGACLFGTASFAQETCPVPAGHVDNPLSTPSVTASEVAANPTDDNLRSLAVAARDYAANTVSPMGLVYLSCLMRQEGGDWRSGEIYAVSVSFNPEVLSDAQAPVNMRVIFHAADMSLSGRQLNEASAKAILTAAMSDPLNGGPVPGIGGHAALYTPYIMLAGIAVREAHLDQADIQSDYNPSVTASDVVDRATLREFVDGAIDLFDQVVQAEGAEAIDILRGVFRDENGPWRAGPVYLFVMDRTGYTLFHGAFPDKYELQLPTQTLRDAVTGELILPKIIAAATASEAGGFVEYNFDNPDDETDSAEIPKVSFGRVYSLTVTSPLVGEVSYQLIVGSGYYEDSATVSRVECPDNGIVASAVRTPDNVRAFVKCATAYLAEHGTDEARRAFNEDARWNHGPTYVFVAGIEQPGPNSNMYVYPPDPSREGKPWGEAIVDYGTDWFREVPRMMSLVDSGWIYYSFWNPATGEQEPKASYLVEVDWNGGRAVLGTGIYRRDLPATCRAEEVSATALEESQSDETLREFVRCAAMLVESQGYLAKGEIEESPRWSAGSTYVFVLDSMGNQVMSGNRVRVSGNPLEEWGLRGMRTDRFGGRDMARVGDTFGESYVYYRSFNPSAGMEQPKVGFLKRIVAQGVPLLVGSGYYLAPDDQMFPETSCSDYHVTARAVRTREDVRAFVRCAAEYATEHGPEEARRAFDEDGRWRYGPTYVFVDGIAESGEGSLTHVFPPDPSREGMPWGTSIDSFGSDYFSELHRIMSIVNSGWIYYAFTNPATGLWQPKNAYVMETDWNGDRAAIGAGIYEADLPGTCSPDEVNAANLAADPSDEKLQDFVRCAALTVEKSGYFAGPVLTNDSRWKHGPIYVFGIDAATGQVRFSGNERSFRVSGRIPELLFEGRDAIQALADFGEGFWYYSITNPATGEPEPKVSFLKLAVTNDGAVLVGAGYNPAHRDPSD